jgi:hypothetical protein
VSDKLISLLAEFASVDLVLCSESRWKKIKCRYEVGISNARGGGLSLALTPFELISSRDVLVQRFLEESLAGKNVKVL